MLLEISADQFFLAAKGVVEGGLGNAGALNNPVDSDYMHAFGVEELIVRHRTAASGVVGRLALQLDQLADDLLFT